MPSFLILTTERKLWKNRADYVASHPGTEELEWVVDFLPVSDQAGEWWIDANSAEEALQAVLAVNRVPRHSLAIQEESAYVATHRSPDPLHGIPSASRGGNASPHSPRRNNPRR